VTGDKDITRKCIVSGEVRDKDLLLRFVLTPDGVVVPDFGKKLPGKGVYVCAYRSALKKAIEKGLFSKALKVKAKADDSLLEMSENILRKKGLESINLARKAGILITGFEKVIEAAKRSKLAFVVEANDAGKDGHNRILSVGKDLEVCVL